jgi:hypothetical protein
MSTVPPNDLRTRRGNLNRTGAVIVIIGMVIFAAWLVWGIVAAP